MNVYHHTLAFITNACSALVQQGFYSLAGGDSGRVIPVPIPNTEVKPSCADGTAAVSYTHLTLPTTPYV